MIDVARGTIAVYSDIACPWAHLSVYRLQTARRKLGLDGAVRLDHRCFPLEVFNERATPKRTLEAEIPVAGGLQPDAGWHMWKRRDSDWPITTLLPMEAVQAVKAQSLEASETLDRALRVGLFDQSRTISLRHVIIEIAGECDGIDVDALTEAIDDGRSRRSLFDHKAVGEKEGVKGSPHLFLPDGSDAHNPGITMHWEGGSGGFPVIESDDPEIYDDIVRRAASTAAR